MKVFFFAPFKPISSPIPSGDREIARGLHAYLKSHEKVKILSEYRSVFFWKSARALISYPVSFFIAFFKVFLWRPDYFFTYHMYYKAPDPFAFIFALLFRKPHFVFEGMYSDKPRHSWSTWIGWWTNKQSLSRASHVFTDKRDDIAGLLKILPKNKVTHIPPSVDVNFFKRVKPDIVPTFLDGKKNIIVGIAMLRPDRKSEGVEFLIRCLAELKKEGLEFFYVHIGDGDRMQYMQELSKDLLSDSVYFAGRLDKKMIRNYLSMADIFAFPGIDEGFGLVYVEAQACGLPVVAFDNGGVPEAVANGRSGFLSELMNKEEMKKSLRILITDKAQREKMSKEARLFVEEKFDKEKNYKKMLGIIHSNLGSPLVVEPPK